MLPPLKLNSIDKEHLQELFDATGLARDELPYTEKFDAMWQGFQDRTFKNAEREQVFGALLKYTRTGSKQSAELPPGQLSDDQLKQLKAIATRHAKGGKVLPYSEEFEAARAEFRKAAGGAELSDADFWRELMRSHGSKRKPPVRKKAVAVEETDDGGADEDGE
ncbi:MAG TPA: hypothetical protein VK324_11535 [Tepidisphaeraceae bacterium]|nr:hypothetical protein [Tepidisphaeraceae bacterium]